MIDSSVVSGECPALDKIIRSYWIGDFCQQYDTCTWKVIRQDTVAPILTCPIDTIIDCDSAIPVLSSLTDYINQGGDTTDNCSVDPATWELIDSIVVSGACPALDTIIRSYRIGDYCQQYDTCSWKVIRQDTVAPMLT